VKGGVFSPPFPFLKHPAVKLILLLTIKGINLSAQLKFIVDRGKRK
jgi:hypothetical protein